MRWEIAPALLGLCLQASAAAAPFPARPIRFIVPNGAGGTTDLVARAIAPKLAAGIGQQVVISPM